MYTLFNYVAANVCSYTEPTTNVHMVFGSTFLPGVIFFWADISHSKEKKLRVQMLASTQRGALFGAWAITTFSKGGQGLPSVSCLKSGRA